MRRTTWESRMGRVLGILGRLSPHSQCTVSDLAAEYRVSAKTIERDLDALRDANLGVYEADDRTIRIHRGGYRRILRWMTGE